MYSLLKHILGHSKKDKQIDTISTGRKTIKVRKEKWEEKQLYGYFKWKTGEIAHEKTWTWLQKGNLTRKTESLPIAPKSITKTNKAKIDYYTTE